MRNESSITTNATGEASGGNITIDTDTLVAIPGENSDISANAEQSFGGQVNITADAIFGTQFRQAPTLESDITATSGLGAEFSGVVQIQTPDVDPASGLFSLTEDTSDPSEQIVAGCEWTADSEFIITGRGGIRPQPDELIQSRRAWTDLRDLSEFRRPKVSLPQPQTAQPQLVEATGWIMNEDGQVELVAVSPETSHSPWRHRPHCSSGTQIKSG